jgi:hypothetical protein
VTPLLLLARVRFGPPGFGLVMLPFMGLFWLATKAVDWFDDKSRPKQLAGQALLTTLGAGVLYLMYAFVQALVG